MIHLSVSVSVCLPACCISLSKCSRSIRDLCLFCWYHHNQMIGVLWHFQEEKDEVSNFGTFMPMHDDTDTNTACFYLTNLSLLKYIYLVNRFTFFWRLVTVLYWVGTGLFFLSFFSTLLHKYKHVLLCYH